ncbi:MAG: transcriptional regulator GcvA [Betaproteobacteria bacterium]|nr:transcriptional regulator GcvA [Betaproteobacteria bacterium]MDE2354359.1 transcriptional regulator GcvA [Betaproteobacteria bacterium]
MPRRLPSLNALRAFEAAARHQSFVRAAEELHVTPGAISQHIKSLEDDLGVTLFRRGRRLALSDAAGELWPLVADAFDQIERAVSKVRQQGAGNTLVVSTPPAFASRWLIPRLEAFQERHPGIELRLLATQRLVNFQLEDVDLAIRFGTGDYPGLQVERLMPEAIIPVAAPALAQDIRTPADLARSPLLEDESHAGSGLFPDWATWLATLGVRGGAPLRIRRFGDTSLALQAASTGLGATLTWYSLVVDDLQAGRLVHLLNQTIPTSLGYHLVVPPNRVSLHKVQAFRAWLLEASARQAPPAGA